MFKAFLKTTLLSTTLFVTIVSTSFANDVIDSTATVTQSQNMHDVWNNLVNKNVIVINNGHSTEVDYAAMQAQRDELNTYLASLSMVTLNEFNRFEKPKQLAFLINAYNAWTVNLILTKYPKIKSIKDLGNFFSSPWSKDFVPLLGETRSLNNIEHDLIRGAVDDLGNPKYNDPRIHFAVNCASIGCPALRTEAYTADKLEQQLEEQTILFLSDTTRNVAKANKLSVSSIFKWYEEDFEQNFRGTNSLSEFMLLYSEALELLPSQVNALKNEDMKIKFLDYNWNLNARH